MISEKDKIKNKKSKSIKFTYIIVLMCIILVMILLFGYFSYTNYKGEMEKNISITTTQTVSSITDYITMTEKNYEFAASKYNDILENSLVTFEKEYDDNKGNIDSIDLDKIRKEYDDVIDLYIINSEGIIEESTYSDALGLDFKDTPRFYKALTELRNGEESQISNVTTDRNNGQKRKWGYNPTKDHKYVLEVGISVEDISGYDNSIDYKTLVEHEISSVDYIKDISIYDVNKFDITTETQNKSEEIREKLDKVLDGKKGIVEKDNYGFANVEYIYLDNLENDLDDSQKVICIEYDYSRYLTDLRNKFILYFIVFFIYGVIMAGIIYFVTSKIVTKPLGKLSKSIAYYCDTGIYKEPNINGRYEVMEVATAFKKMTNELAETYVARDYFENLINSIGDYVIILDKNLNVLRMNNALIEDIEGDESSYLNNSLEKLFSKDFNMKELLKELKDGKESLNVEADFIISRKKEVHIIATFSNLGNDNTRKEKYICNITDISRIIKLLRELESKNKNLVENEKFLLINSRTDALTKLYNHGYITEKLEASLGDNTKDTSVIMLDIDFFKNVNDTYGHLAGDDVLRSMAFTILKCIREEDYVGRYGGEEFLVIVSGNKDLAKAVAERIRVRVQEDVYSKDDIKITISGGVSSQRVDDTSETIIERADKNLYIAKRGGRNRIIY